MTVLSFSVYDSAMFLAGEDDGFLATGGADARVNVWRDCTAEDEATAAAERTETVLKAQDLANALKVALSYHESCRLMKPYSLQWPCERWSLQSHCVSKSS